MTDRADAPTTNGHVYETALGSRLRVERLVYGPRRASFLYTFVNSNRSVLPPVSRAWNVSSVRFASLELHHDAPSGELPDEC
jgi:hypothetical protein